MKINLLRIFDVFFIISFASYAIGLNFMEVVLDKQITALKVIDSKKSLLIGGILIIVIHTLSNLGLTTIMFHLLKVKVKSWATVYFVLSCFATFMLALGAVFLLLPISISEIFIQSKVDPFAFVISLDFASSGYFYCYQFGIILWACGGLIFSFFLCKCKLAPSFFSVWGYIGYLILLIGCFLELFGVPYGILLSLPGGLFEVVLSVWFVVKNVKNN